MYLFELLATIKRTQSILQLEEIEQREDERRERETSSSIIDFKNASIYWEKEGSNQISKKTKARKIHPV